MLQRLFQNMPPVTKNLLILNVLFWGAMTLVPVLDVKLTQWCALHYFTSPGFNVAQLFTYMFLHSGFMHLFFNMFMLVMFGGIIERSMGSSRFLFYYISCGLFAALIQMGAYAVVLSKYYDMFTPEQMHEIIYKGWSYMKEGYTFTDPTFARINSLVNGPMVGASGAIYSVLLAFGMLYPNQPLYLMFIPVPIKAKWMVLGSGVIELLLGINNNAADNVAHFAHLGGMIAGVMLILYWKKKGVFNNHWFF